MGLDVIAVKRLPQEGDSMIEAVHDDELEKLNVVRGIFTLSVPDTGASGSGIRGAAYEAWVASATPYSLYSNLDADDVRKLAEALEQGESPMSWDVSLGERDDVVKWFRRCADQGYALYAWY